MKKEEKKKMKKKKKKMMMTMMMKLSNCYIDIRITARMKKEEYKSKAYSKR